MVCLLAWLYSTLCRSSSVVERHVANVNVVGSNPTCDSNPVGKPVSLNGLHTSACMNGGAGNSLLPLTKDEGAHDEAPSPDAPVF
jgi:hypothetical protein